MLESFFGRPIIYGEKIGFIGLGKLGMPCAEAIRKKGFHVAGYDIEEKRSDLVEMRGSIEDLCQTIPNNLTNQRPNSEPIASHN